jgi:tetratricopeptide (TPR) repeat protein
LVVTTGLAVAITTVAGAQQSPTPAPPPAPSKAERIADRAIVSLVGWKTKAAENVLASSEAELGTTPEYLTALGLLRAVQGKGEEATKLLQGAAKASPKDPAPQYYLGEVLYWDKSYDDAGKAWKAARDRAKTQVDASAADSRAQYYLGAAQVRLKQFGPARKALEAARDAGFDPVLVDYQLGLSFALDEKWQDAVNAFDAAVDKDAKFAHAYFYRGLAWGKLDRKDKMLIDLDLFTKLAPGAPEVSTANAMLAAGK